jgi:hypothetical protein
MINLEWNIVNVIGLFAIIIEGCGLAFMAYKLNKRENSNFFSNHYCDSTKYSPENEQTQPESPHRPIPIPMCPKTSPITQSKANNYCEKIFYKHLSLIIRRLATKCKQYLKLPL